MGQDPSKPLVGGGHWGRDTFIKIPANALTYYIYSTMEIRQMKLILLKQAKGLKELLDFLEISQNLFCFLQIL